MMKPRAIKNKTGTLTAYEDDKGKRSIEIDIRHDAMTTKQARTIHSKLLELIIWCDRLA
jgi:hypothetical protein